MERWLRRHRAFSLVELVVVVVIIGALAAIALPRISQGAVGSSAAAVKANLNTMRKAIDMYAAEHGGVFPGENADGLGGAARSEQALVSQLIKFSDYSGNASATRDQTHRFGPYLAHGIPPAPLGAFAGSTAVKVVITGPERVAEGSYGWVYNVLIGEIILNTTAAEEATIIDKFDIHGKDIGLPAL